MLLTLLAITGCAPAQHEAARAAPSATDVTSTKATVQSASQPAAEPTSTPAAQPTGRHTAHSSTQTTGTDGAVEMRASDTSADASSSTAPTNVEARSSSARKAASHVSTFAEHALPEGRSVPGGLALLHVGSTDSARPSVSYLDRPVYVTRRGEDWVAAVGIPLAAEPGEHTVLIETPGMPGVRLRFDVAEASYETQSLTIANRRKVNPNPDDQARIRREWDKISIAKNVFSTDRQTDLAFDWPLRGRISSQFGLRRIYNGQPRSPHAGLDIAAPTGTPIRAPSPGTVVDTGDYFFNGKTVFIDHGHGFVSMYCHLSALSVEEGDVLATGDKLGEVGATGRVTGPHLHWSALLNGQMFDPTLLMKDP